MSALNLLLISPPYQIMYGGLGNTRLPHKVPPDFLYLHTVEIYFGLLGPQITWFRLNHSPKQISALVPNSVLGCLGLDIVRHIF